MKKFRILWFNWRCWLNPAMGGAEVFTREVASRWVRYGHDVTLFTSEFSGCKREEFSEGVNIVRSGGRLSVYYKAKEFYKKQQKIRTFDIIIDEINTRPFFSQNFAQEHTVVIALIHQLAREYWFYETPFPISYLGYHFLEKNWLRQYITVPMVTVSESTRHDLSRLGLKNISVVPEGLGFFPITNIKQTSEPVIVFAGRLKSTKRPEHAIKAFNIVKENIPDAKLWVIGTGPLRSKLERMAKEGVTFFGYLDSSSRRTLIGKSCVLINPGLREGWGLNIIEANALGVPAVAYNVPGLCDSVKDRETGLLVPSGNYEKLAEATIRVLKDQNLHLKLSTRALEYSRIFSWDKTADQFMNYVDKCYNEKMI